MKHIHAGFLIGATKKEDFPVSSFPEIAFIGRSNVGKSSLLNSLVLDSKLAKVSQTPGKTQQINFFPINSKWMFVDLPGFGYAKVSREEREKWNKLNHDFLLEREQLRMTCILVDSRHDPQPLDLSTIEMMENAGRKYVVILTKTDKLKQTQVEERLEQVKGLLQFCTHCVDVILYSTVSKVGRNELWGIIKRETEV